MNLVVDFPVDPVPRWGYGLPPHPQVAALVEDARDGIAERLRSYLVFSEELAAIPLDGDGAEPGMPYWANGYFQGLDAVSLYGTIATARPARYLEIGAGNSTKFARRAIDAHGLETRIISVDPTPRSALAGLAHEHHQVPLQHLDPTVFDGLAAGDVLMLDGSHRCFTNSDVTVFFTEVLPRVPAGVHVYIDDVFLPWDYPPQIADRWYSEQYLLAAWLLAGDRLSIGLPNFWISTEPDLHGILAPIWKHLTWAGVPTNGTGFWLTVDG